MKNRVIVNGAHGKMGSLACATIEKDPDLILVAACDHGDDLVAAIKKYQADIVVDLTSAEVVYQNTRAIIESNVHPVIGSTGLLSDQIAELQQLAAEKNLGGIIAPNFSIGAILMMKFAAEASKYFHYMEILEYHHEKKLDAPSGTAIKTADMIAATGFKAIELSGEKELLSGARGAKHHNIPIHSIRMSGLMAHQEVICGGTGETLTIRHDSINRECFMPGILLACKSVEQLNSLMYGLEHILEKN